MKLLLFFSKIIIMAMLLNGCTSTIPASDDTPPVISVLYSGRLDNGSSTSNAMPAVTKVMRVAAGEEFNLTFTASDKAVRIFKIEIPTGFDITVVDNNGTLTRTDAADKTILNIDAPNTGESGEGLTSLYTILKLKSQNGTTGNKRINTVASNYDITEGRLLGLLDFIVVIE